MPLCAEYVESAEHALLMCTASDPLLTSRVDCLVRVTNLRPAFVAQTDEEDALTALRALFGEKAVHNVLGTYIRKVFGILEAVELQWPGLYTERE